MGFTTALGFRHLTTAIGSSSICLQVKGLLSNARNTPTHRQYHENEFEFRL